MPLEIYLNGNYNKSDEKDIHVCHFAKSLMNKVIEQQLIKINNDESFKLLIDSFLLYENDDDV